MAAYPKLVPHVPFYGIYCQPGVTTIKFKRLFLKFWLGGQPTPGKGKGQKHIDGNIRRSPAAKKGRASYLAG